MRPLLERTGELEAIRSLLDRCAAGEGAVLLVEGPAGIGKTALLESARVLASDAGVRVLTARGGELELETPHAPEPHARRSRFRSRLATSVPRRCGTPRHGAAITSGWAAGAIGSHRTLVTSSTFRRDMPALVAERCPHCGTVEFDFMHYGQHARLHMLATVDLDAADHSGDFDLITVPLPVRRLESDGEGQLVIRAAAGRPRIAGIALSS